MGNWSSGDTQQNEPEDIISPDTSRARWTPIDALKENLATCPEELQALVLYTCGSLCPVHRQHIHIQELVCGLSIAGFVASSHDDYVRGKYSFSGRMDSFIPWDQRMELVDVALKGHPWIRADRWDGQQERFHEYYEAQDTLRDFMTEWCKLNSNGRTVKVLMCGGADLVLKCRLQQWYPSKGLGCVCLERPGYLLPTETSHEDQLKNFFFITRLSEEYIAEHGAGDVSSTQVQALMKAQDPEKDLIVSKLLHPRVEASLRTLWNLPKKQN